MKKILLYIMLALIAVSCSKQNLADLNKNVTSPSDVPGNTLFSYAEKQLSDQTAFIDQYHSALNQWVQYLTATTYTYDANFEIAQYGVPDYSWNDYYSILNNLKGAYSLIKAESPISNADIAAQKNRLAIIDILSCYAWDRMEMIWGNIPYSQALNPKNVLPAYDDALTIHKDLISRVDSDIKKMDPSNSSFGSYDLIYSGDVSLWKEFAEGLLVKMAVQIADVNSENDLIKTTIQDAMGGTFPSAGDNAIFHYLSSSPNTNPLYVSLTLSGRQDFVIANTLADKMNSLKDPRRPFYFDQNLGTSTYVGGTYGNTNTFSLCTHINTTISKDPTFGNPLMTYSEIQFYLAEAAARGIISGDAATYYNHAVTASITYWASTYVDAQGNTIISQSEAQKEAAVYLAQPDVAYNKANWKELIGTQAWISFYLRGFNGWTEWRRLDVPTMNEPPHPYQVTTFPVRYPYPTEEQTLNGENYNKAASAIGGDLMSTRLYWDIN